VKVAVAQVGAGDVIRALQRAVSDVPKQMAEAAFTIGAKAVEEIKREYRSTGSRTSTWVRSGQLRRSYAHTVKRTGSAVTMEVGAIRPTAGGKIPLHAHIHEGIDAQGNRVNRWVIRPTVKPYLVFPIRRGGGLAKSNIIGWVKTRQVVIYPRPALDPVGRKLVDQLQARGLQVVKDAL
jgi:hypothetical protein